MGMVIEKNPEVGGYGGDIVSAQQYEALAKRDITTQLKGEMGKVPLSKHFSEIGDLDSKLDTHYQNLAASAYGHTNRLPPVSKKQRRERRLRKKLDTRKADSVLSLECTTEDVSRLFGVDNNAGYVVDIYRVNPYTRAGDVYELVGPDEHIERIDQLQRWQVEAIDDLYRKKSKEIGPNSFRYSPLDKNFRKIAKVLYGKNSGDIGEIVIKYNPNGTIYSIRDKKGKELSKGGVGILTKEKKDRLPLSVINQLSVLQAKFLKQKGNQGLNFGVGASLETRLGEETAFYGSVKGYVPIYDQEGKLLALKLQISSGRGEGDIKNKGFDGGLAAIFKSGNKAYYIGGFYQWLKEKGHEFGVRSVEHSQIAFVSGVKEGKNQFNLFVGLPLSEAKGIGSDSTSSTTTDYEGEGQDRVRVETKKTSTKKWFREAVKFGKFSWRHNFNEWIDGIVSICYSKGAGNKDGKFQFGVGVEVEKGPWQLRAEAMDGEGSIEGYLAITYWWDWGDKNSDGDQKDILKKLKIEPIQLVGYDTISHLIEEKRISDPVEEQQQQGGAAPPVVPPPPPPPP